MNSEMDGKILSDVSGVSDVADATANELNATKTNTVMSVVTVPY